MLHKNNISRQISYNITYVWNLKYDKMNLFTKHIFTDIENKFMVIKGETGGR